MKVGLVLGAGGVTGAAWLIGALDALAEESGWDPALADVVVGTSAGAAIAGVVAGGGIPPGFLVAHAAGEVLHPDWEDERSPGASYRLHPALPGIGPGSWRMALGTLRNAGRHPPGAVLAGWLPAGLVSTEPLKRLVRT